MTAVVQGGDTNSAVERVLVQEVHDAVSDLVDLIKTYQSKNRLSKVLTSTLFKRRQEEMDAVVDRAILHLHVSVALLWFALGGVNDSIRRPSTSEIAS